MPHPKKVKNWSIERIKDFLPDLGNINPDLEFSAHNFKKKGKMKVQNLNNEKISKLSNSKIKEINSYFIKEKDLLDYFGYTLIEC